MIDAISSLITKEFNVQSIDFNFLFQTDIATTIILFIISINNAFITTFSIIFKDKSIKSDKMRFYKDLNINKHVR